MPLACFSRRKTSEEAGAQREGGERFQVALGVPGRSLIKVTAMNYTKHLKDSLEVL